MSSPASGGPPPEFSDSDQQWYAALSGVTAPGQESHAAVEGQALRMALDQRQREVAVSPELLKATGEDAMQLQLQRLQDRVRSEGVFEHSKVTAPAPPSESSPNVVTFPWWRSRRAFVALAASVLVGLVVVQQWIGQPDYPPPPIMMGADGLQQVRVQQPRKAAERLADQLRQAGLKPGLYQRGEVYVVDINLMHGELVIAEPSFEALQLKPVVGFNRAEIGSR